MRFIRLKPLVQGDDMHRTQEQLYLARLQAHNTHLKYIYAVRMAGIGLSALVICAGTVMVFMGLQGSFDWAIQAPNSIGAKLTNASPGIVFVTVGMFIGIVVIAQRPVEFITDIDSDRMQISAWREPPPPWRTAVSRRIAEHARRRSEAIPRL
jgi:hypothetical protein